MKIVVLGYGKMGKAVEAIAIERGHQIILTVSNQDNNTLTYQQLQQADVIIEFTHPNAAFQHILLAFEAQVPIVCGTTGWLEQLPEAQQRCKEKNGTLFWASNFSMGVHVFFELNRYLAQLMAKMPNYDLKIKEIHHTQKLDAPSGTAITLAQGIIENHPLKTHWQNEISNNDTALYIESERTGTVAGTHIVTYSSIIDDIQIAHEAHSRIGFATGAVVAAEWLVGKKGFFTMHDLMGF
jgi:4-hydroxy-tetrahydrodipicolinate reductase